MQLSQRALGVLAMVVLAGQGSRLSADVNLLVSKKGAPSTTAFSVPANSSFDISVTVQTTSSEPLTGVDYCFTSMLGTATAPATFLIATQDLTNSIFPAFNGPAFVSSNISPPTPDEGSSLNFPYTPTVTGGPFQVSDFHIQALPAASVGSVYTIAFSPGGAGQLDYLGPAPSFPPGDFHTLGKLSITITSATPEPSSAVCFTGCGAALVLRRRRR